MLPVPGDPHNKHTANTFVNVGHGETLEGSNSSVVRRDSWTYLTSLNVTKFKNENNPKSCFSCSIQVLVLNITDPGLIQLRQGLKKINSESILLRKTNNRFKKS